MLPARCRCTHTLSTWCSCCGWFHGVMVWIKTTLWIYFLHLYSVLQGASGPSPPAWWTILSPVLTKHLTGSQTSWIMQLLRVVSSEQTVSTQSAEEAGCCRQSRPRDNEQPQSAPGFGSSARLWLSHFDDHSVLSMFGLVGEVRFLRASVPNQHLEGRGWRNENLLTEGN